MPGPSNSRKKKQKPAPPKNMATTSTLPCLYIPDDSAPDHPVEQRTLVFPPGATFDDVVCPVLQCPERVAETIYSEHLSDVYEGRPPTPPESEFVMYEAYMDDNGNATRPYNTRAAHMLLRPKSHGPMLVVKVICTRDRGTGADVPVRFAPLAARELESAEFRAKKARYDGKKAVYEEAVLAQFRREGGIVINL
ncbi:hypothetical protein HYPSUDRAFT_199179 [Hypholoma sublateritium FD-334 SS-4]|uniref:Uncharacterized protein n=1 Tax=Hypholoma sublateritium (strain FD-334 SS-4) TaxID=945553 RepID=A0A0D2MPP9_HYPSF|nr:hypothetical protein HYPSUDRAFT_199179 [Hypholoma sublateritium FD-334 SS-4]